MPETTPAQELREAARLMRKRAEVAKPGPWKTQGRPFGGRSYVSSTSGACWDVAVLPTEDAKHIAGMHPGVALAVAGWLEQEADECCVPLSGALAVARTYLGTKEDDDE